MPEALKIPEYTPITPDNYVQITRAIRQAMAEGAEPEFVCLADPKEELEEGKVYAITQVDQDNEILFNIGKAMRHGMLNERNCVQSGTNVSLTCPRRRSPPWPPATWPTGTRPCAPWSNHSTSNTPLLWAIWWSGNPGCATRSTPARRFRAWSCS